MPALKFDRTPGQHAAAEKSPPHVASVPPVTFARVASPERITIPEPYTLGQRVVVAGFRYGRVFNACPCVCDLGDKFVYVVELDVIFRGSLFHIGHSNEVEPVDECDE